MTPELSRPEFSRIERLDAIGEERRVVVSATGAERAALAARFGLLAIDALEGDFAIRRVGGGVSVRGEVRGAVVQACAATGDPLPARIAETVALLFVEPGQGGDEEEIELAADTLDTVEIEGGGIDLGETAAETMALALDPFPRSPAAAETLKAAGVVSEEEAGPFGALAGLKQALEKK